MPSARSNKFIESKQASATQPAFTWSPMQLDIIRWFREGEGNLVVDALAGTSKSTTIRGGVEQAYDDSILIAAFNKRIQTEMDERIDSPKVKVLTWHSVGYRSILRSLDGDWKKGARDKGVRPYERAKHLASLVTVGAPYGSMRLVQELVDLGRQLVPVNTTVDSLEALAADFGVLPMPGDSLSINMVAQMTLRAMDIAATREPVETGIDFSDQIFLPLRLGLLQPDYDLVVVDEYQDMTFPQLSMARAVCKPWGRIALFGDRNQCQPGDTEINANGEIRRLDSLKPGDVIDTYDRHAGVVLRNGVVNDVAARDYEGFILDVTAGGQTTTCTPNHKWLVRWLRDSKPAWVTYLMRQGSKWRVGQCQLFGPTDGFHLGQRARLEKADAAWILKIHSSREEAYAHEQIVSARYGLPQLVFDLSTVTRLSLTQGTVNRIFAEIGKYTDQHERAVKCLHDHGRYEEYPIYKGGCARRGRTTLCEMEACNLFPEYMALPVPVSGSNKVTWKPLSLMTRWYSGKVYSLDVAKHHKYVADGLVTCNSIYGFRGATSTSVARFTEELQATVLPLHRTYRCPKRVVAIAKQFVPDFEAEPSAPEGTIDSVESVGALVEAAQPGDFILSRTNAPLAPIAMALMRAKKRTKIQGRKIGQGLVSLVRQLAKGAAAESIPEFCKRLVTWEDKQIERLTAMKREDKCDDIKDQADTIRAFAIDAESVAALIQRIEYLFEDDAADAVICSTVHRAKGLEANRVFVLKHTFFMRVACECGHRHRSDYCVKCRCEQYRPDGAKQREESNLYYVAVTRSKNHLTFYEELRL